MRLIVIGGGAAGFFCAVNAARMDPNCKVTIVEKTSKLLSKVRISGGGRCNVTHACFSIPDMIKQYPRGVNFVKKTMHQFFTSDTIRWFEERNVKLKTEEDGRMFPVTDNSQTIIDCLIREANKHHVGIMMNRDVKSVRKQNGEWLLEMANGEHLSCDKLCLACGGYPKASMFDWIKNTGHTIEDPVPSLFTFNMPGNRITALQGVSVPDAIVRVEGTKLIQRGPLLITHWGMSGPAVLKTSAWGARLLHEKSYEFTASVNWLPNMIEQDLRDQLNDFRQSIPAQFVYNRNAFGLPQRLWSHIVEEAGIASTVRWSDLNTASQHKLVKNLLRHEFSVKGKTTFKEEFVTAGGVKLSEIEANTMESRIHPGLYFAGEIMDVDGVTGGFNFQHAWTSGYIAAKGIVKR
jgi:predicted Rossmann fold flavoprotein